MPKFDSQKDWTEHAFNPGATSQIIEEHEIIFSKLSEEEKRKLRRNLEQTVTIFQAFLKNYDNLLPIREVPIYLSKLKKGIATRMHTSYNIKNKSNLACILLDPSILNYSHDVQITVLIIRQLVQFYSKKTVKLKENNLKQRIYHLGLETFFEQENSKNIKVGTAISQLFMDSVAFLLCIKSQKNYLRLFESATSAEPMHTIFKLMLIFKKQGFSERELFEVIMKSLLTGKQSIFLGID